MLHGRLHSRKVGKLSFLCPFREGTGMMDKHPLHQESRQTQERSLLFHSIRTGRAKGFDFYELEIKLMDYRSWLERVIHPLRPHTRGGDSPKLRVEKLHQTADGLLVAVTKARHQCGYRIRFERA